MATDENPAWYHGAIERPEAEQRLISASSGFVHGQCLFLVRKSKSSPKDFVVSCLVAGVGSLYHFIVNVTVDGGMTYYELEIKDGPKQPKFPNILVLIDYYKSPAAGLPPGPLAGYVPSPESAARAFAPAASPFAAVPAFAAPAPVPVGMPPVSPFAAAVPAPAPVAASPFVVVPAPSGPVDARHPVLLPPAVASAVPSHAAPATGMASGAGGGLYRDPLSRGPSGPEELLAEGYLVKIRGIGQNNKRYFRLTTSRLSCFDRDSGDEIDGTPLDDVTAVSDVSKTQLRVITKTPFGTGNRTEMLLEASSQRIKDRWLHAFRQDVNYSGGFRGKEGRLMAEGYLVKLQGFGSSNTTRWFVLTDQHLAYYKEEAGEIMASVPLVNVTTVALNGDREFRVIANERFTATGSYEVHLRCESDGVRNKWVTQMQRVLPPDVFQR